MDKVTIGISSCLLGNNVRYNGVHQHDRFITGPLGPHCRFVPICPEVKCGLTVPRETMRLVGTRENPRLVTHTTLVDHTERMENWAADRLERTGRENIVAFIFKTKSPSSGLRNIKIYNDDGRLHDPVIRENFIETIFILQRWREGPLKGTKADLVDFHKRHKYALMAHSPDGLRALGRITAKLKERSFDESLVEYRQILGSTLEKRKQKRRTTMFFST